VDEIQRKDARMKNPENNLIFFASFASLHCYPSESSKTARILDCGGRAQRRHRFSTADRASKAAWRFASRRSPKRFGCGFAVLPLCVKIGT
jgi:hypothetical protein